MTYVVADLHGRADRFHQILEQLPFSRNDEMYILGDVIDRNPDGIELMEEIMDTDNMHMLLGNHEYMMRNAIRDPYHPLNEWFTNLDLWYFNGGEVTRRAFLRLDQPRQERILAWLDGLPLNIPLRCGGKDYLLVHGSPVSLYPGESGEYASLTEFAVWNRFDPLLQSFDPGTTLICGHTPTVNITSVVPMEVFKWKNVLCIDCGCAYETAQGGRLACLCLETGEILYSSC